MYLKKFRLLILLILLPGFSQSQTSRLKFGGGLSIGLGENYVKPESSLYAINFTPVMSYSFQGNAEFRILNSLFLQTGIRFDNWRAKTIYFLPPWSGTKYKNTYGTFSFGIPTRFLFLPGKGKLSPAFQLGANWAYAFGGTSRQHVNSGNGYELTQKGSTTADQLGRNFLLSLDAGAGIQYQYSENVLFRILPFFEYQVTNYFPMDSGVIGRKWRTGISLNCMFGK